FSTAPSPAAAAAAKAGVDWVRSAEGEHRRQLLWARVDDVKNVLTGSQWIVPVVRSAILPLMIGDETKAMEIATALRARGVFIPAIRYPTVARGEARLRLTVTATHSLADIEQLREVLAASAQGKGGAA
ncbi:MAG: 8-amino-7-oxononanoate synthase, partial [Verrucomicrobiales bacterium]|nr:8-amino-7-oxononanoate synthase [Verrucomicrobiales bacterium]